MSTLDVDQFRGGDQDVRDGGIAQQRFERAKAEDLIEHFLDDAFLLRQTERRTLFVSQFRHRDADLGARALTGQRRKRFQVNAVEKLAMYGELQFLILGA